VYHRLTPGAFWAICHVTIGSLDPVAQPIENVARRIESDADAYNHEFFGGSGHEAAQPRADASVLPRQLIFGNPDRAAPKLSPDGKRLAWLAPRDGVLNVYVATGSELASARAVTAEKVRPVANFVWTYDSKHLLYAIDKNGDENVHVFSVDVDTSALKDLTPFEKTQGRILGLSQKHRTLAVLGINDRDPKHHDGRAIPGD
jgi:hypothetical protein